MFPNLSLSPPVSQRHTAALKSTARATALPKCHHSAQHTRCVTDWAGASFCVLHYMKTDVYLHDRGICNTRITYKSPNCFWFACSLQRAQPHAVLTKQCTFSMWAQEVPRKSPHRQHRLPIFHQAEIKSWSRSTRISAPASLQIHVM